MCYVWKQTPAEDTLPPNEAPQPNGESEGTQTLKPESALEEAQTVERSADSPSELSGPAKQSHLCHELKISESGDVEVINVTEVEGGQDSEERHAVEAESQVSGVFATGCAHDL